LNGIGAAIPRIVMWNQDAGAPSTRGIIANVSVLEDGLHRGTRPELLVEERERTGTNLSMEAMCQRTTDRTRVRDTHVRHARDALRFRARCG
jgi:hypothetical protein